ncbi:hypothetical protein, partial [Brachybacterium paraconglomeratum]|uniref:hypothetical protein n=1 Tax=Brachybacterium paraconglomeratum TaxID=173362 RepID=UPI0022AF04B4
SPTTSSAPYSTPEDSEPNYTVICEEPIYAYNAYADLLPYANQRPPYLARQVEEDWNASRQ